MKSASNSHIQRFTHETVDKSQLSHAVKRNFLRARQYVPSAIPSAPIPTVATVAGSTGIGKGRVDVTLAVERQIMRFPCEGEFAAVEHGAPCLLGDKARAGFALEFGEGICFFVAIGKPTENGRLVMRFWNQPDQRPFVYGDDIPTPPLNSSTYVRTRMILGKPPAFIAKSTRRKPSAIPGRD